MDCGIIERLYKKDIREGEEKLMLAVLESAVEDFQNYVLSKGEKERKLFREAEEWFLKIDSDQLFPFEYVCESLQLDPDYIRQGLLSWKEARRRKHPVQARRAGCQTLMKTRAARRSARLSKTG